MNFLPLPVSSLTAGTGFQRPYYYSPNPVKVGYSALEVMTDLKFVPAATVLVDADAESCSQLMIARGVRLLLVVDAARDVVGLITARDLLGGKPERVMRAKGIGHHEVLVRDVMTGADAIEVLALDDVLLARVGDIVATLRNSGRQHALVVDRDIVADKPIIRGVFSASPIARQLGIALPSADLSHTFAEIDEAMTATSGD